MKRSLPAVAAVVAIVACGVVHGFWTGRWSGAASGGEMAARLRQVALDLGDWQGRDLDADVRLKEGMVGVLYRSYVHRPTGKAVTVYLVCGRSGPVAVHTPDVCYAASGFDVTPLGRQAVRAKSGATLAELEAARMSKKRAAEHIQQHIFWSWSATGTWQVPDNPRLAFARYPLLYKLYLLRDLSRPGEAADEDPCLDLMRQLQPELQRVLFPGT
jgi:hypothetical protein